MDTIRKLMPVEVRELGDRILEIAGSTEDVDRMGDVIKAKGWKLGPFKLNPVFMWGHDYNQPPIGRALKVWVDKETKKLMFNIEFADAETYAFADTIYKLYKGGFLHATSVGFIPLDWEGKDEENPFPKWEGNVFTSQELLELSAVPVPANANALVTARDQGLITVKEFEAVTRESVDTLLVLARIESQKLAEEVDAEIMAVNKPEETDDYIRIPNPKDDKKPHKDHNIKHIDIDKDKGIKALYCVDCKIIVTYLFDKDNDENWTMASAQAWVDEHAKNYTLVDVTAVGDEEPQFAIQAAMEGMVEEIEQPKPQARTVTQAQLRDDIDYLDTVVSDVGLSEQTATEAVDVAIRLIARAWPYHQFDSIILGEYLTNEDEPIVFKRLLGNDIPINIGDKQLEPDTPTADELVKQRALEVAEVAQLVIAKLKGKRIY